MPDDLVVLCQCWDLVEANSIRASFEARGVRAQIDGEHHRSMFGMVGAGSELRIMVPASQFDLAQKLAAEIIPDFAPEHDDEDGEPLRSDLSTARHTPAEDSDEDDAEPELKKSVRLAKLLVGSGLAIGIIHIYADRLNQGLLLLFAAALGLALILGGELWGMLLIGVVWFIDAEYGIRLLHEHNRKLEASAEAKAELD